MKLLKLVLFKLLAPQYTHLFCGFAKTFTRAVTGVSVCKDFWPQKLAVCM